MTCTELTILLYTINQAVERRSASEGLGRVSSALLAPLPILDCGLHWMSAPFLRPFTDTRGQLQPIHTMALAMKTAAPTVAGRAASRRSAVVVRATKYDEELVQTA